MADVRVNRGALLALEGEQWTFQVGHGALWEPLGADPLLCKAQPVGLCILGQALVRVGGP